MLTAPPLPMIAVPLTWWERRPELVAELQAQGRKIEPQGDVMMVEQRNPNESAHLLMGRTLDGETVYGASLPTNE